MKDAVMVVRDSASGDSCCGGLVNNEFISMPEASCESRADLQQIGRIYRSLHDSYRNDLDIHQVDPRNSPAIVGYFLRWWHTGQITARELGRQMLFEIRPGAWFYNGRLINPEGLTEDATIRARVRDRYARSGA